MSLSNITYNKNLLNFDIYQIVKFDLIEILKDLKKTSLIIKTIVLIIKKIFNIIAG